ncbi:hypothetical protein CWATWH0003_2664 [Crocosphaera watsonii WH 0003]|uniref:Uncharacterized protein n=2 Tax=Crocosphaera watsonii TaxID=263511 RepID=G5J5A0_CROWT|nr:hypothetical protein CWATWH0003_2664 [Crocosphaera watsonii WH 0003]CCQ56185.1 hypothetical protein CWATWH0005_1095 [Crocosphaera watsonii WH 0005]
MFSRTIFPIPVSTDNFINRAVLLSPPVVGGGKVGSHEQN